MFEQKWQNTKPPKGVLLNKGHPLARGLVGCWLMNEGSGKKIYDVSSNRIDGTFGASNIWSPGKFGPAIKGDAVTFINCGIPNIIYGRLQVSASGWVFVPGNTVPGSQYIFNWVGSGYDVLALGTNTTENVFFWVEDATTHTKNTATWTDGFLNNPGWHHLAGTMDSANVKLYVDGILRATTAWPGGVISTPSVAELLLAVTVELVDLPALWNRTLSPSEVAQLYREPFAMFDKARLWGAGAVTPTANTIFFGTNF